MTPSETSIAEGLSEAQRIILERLGKSKLPAWALREDHLGRKASDDIRRLPAGIVEKVDMSKFGSQHWWYKLTPLGLRIRSYLISKGS